MSFLLIQELPNEEELPVKEEDVRNDNNNFSSSSIPRYFVNDVVGKVNKDNKEGSRVIGVDFGVVCYPKNLQHGERLESVLDWGFTQNFRVSWFQSEEETLENAGDRHIFLVERRLSIGMHVRRASMRSGNVVVVDRLATVQVLPSNQVIANVPLAKLRPMQVNVGSYVLKQDWLGVVTRIERTAILQMPDGDQCSHAWTQSVPKTPGDYALVKTPWRSALHLRILYPGQKVKLSKKNMLQEVTWLGSSSFLGGKWRIVKSGELSIATVLSLEFKLQVKWLDNFPRGFHDRQPEPGGEVKSSELGMDCVIVDEIWGHPWNIGSLATLEYWGENDWKFYSHYDEWLQSLGDGHLEAPNTRNDSSETKSWTKDPNSEDWTRQFHKGDFEEDPDGASEPLKMWKHLKMSNVDHHLYGKNFPVKILKLESWVGVAWPSYLRRLEYLSSGAFFPEILGGDVKTFKSGTIVKLSNAVGEQPTFLKYYGMVVASDSRSGLMATNWYKYLPGSKPKYVGNTNSRPEEVELHPDFGHLNKGSIVTWEDFSSSEECQVTNVGVVERVGDNGMIIVRPCTINNSRNNSPQELWCWPENMKKWMATGFYNPLTEEWIRMRGNFQHMPGFHGASDGRFIRGKSIPSLGNLVQAGIRKSSFILGPGDVLLQMLDRIPALFKFSRLAPNTRIESYELFYTRLLQDILLYSGDGHPGIWIKTFRDRMDILSVAMEGPIHSLYEDVLLFFNVKIPDSFPDSPPLLHFFSYSTSEINPCLKTNGTVLFPLLNTGETFPWCQAEAWDPKESSLGLVLVCIRKLLLCVVPFRNHRHFELLKMFSTSFCNNLCLDKNLQYLDEMILSVINQVESPPEVWREEVMQYYQFHIPRFNNRIADALEGNPEIPMPKMSHEKAFNLRRKLSYLTQLYHQTFPTL